MKLPGLRPRLLVLAFGSMLPLVVLSLVLAVLLFQREQQLVRDGAMDRSRAIASAVDAKLDGHLSALRALGTIEGLERGDLAAFVDAARRVKAQQPHWRNVLLVDTEGRQRLNLRFAPGAELPREDDAQWPSLRAVLADGQPTVGDLGRGPVSGFIGIPLQVRVAVAGEAMALKLILDPDAFIGLMSAQRLPAGWAAALVDATGRFIVRLPHRPVGDLASAGLREAMQRQTIGWTRVRTIEGADAHQAFVRSSLSPWTVAVAIPRADVVAGAQAAGRWLLLGLLASLALASALALAISRRVSAPMHVLARAAREVGSGEAGALQAVQQQPGFAEAAAVASALEQAAASIRERESLQQREQAALREADRAKDEFLAMLGHELRNPLSAITNAAQVLRVAGAGSHADRAHEVMARQTRQMTRFVEDLLDISRLATGKLHLALEVQDLSAVVASALQVWQPTAARQGKSLRFEGTPAWARLDRSRIEQVLNNLVDNALKFSPEGGEVLVTVRPVDGRAVLAVRDHGQGLQAEELSRVFDAFYQGAQPQHRPQGGLGLGLSLVRRLAELHGGAAWADSQGEGRGACFTVALPPAAAPAVTPPAAAPATTTTPRRVLLVEDNDDGRETLRQVLQLAGHEVKAAEDGEAALAMVGAWRPDVALLDIGLPGMDGHEVARLLLALGLQPPLRLIAMSGFGQPQDKARAVAAGFERHLTKPVDPAQLLALLDGPRPQALQTGT